MDITLDMFKQAILVLKENDKDFVNNSLESIRVHKDLAQTEYNEKVYSLKVMFVRFRKYQNQNSHKKAELWYKRTEPWIPLYKVHQNSTVFPEVRTESVKQITDSKKSIEDIDRSISELQLRLIEKAKEAKVWSNKLKTTNIRIQILETAVYIQDFFTVHQYSPDDIADFEMSKYYEQFVKEREPVG